MPIEPSVFHPIKTNDVQQQPLYAYKHYKLDSRGFTTESGFHRHDGQFAPVPPPLHAQTEIYPELFNVTGDESDFQGRKRNKAVIWAGIDARYYRFPYDPGNTMELSDRRTAEKYLNVSCSVLTIPYFDVGEKIKKGSVSASFDMSGSYGWGCQDDTFGNLRDHRVKTASMASSSRNILYLSFNETFRDVRETQQFDGSHHGGKILSAVSNISYALGRDEKFSRFYDSMNEKMRLMVGVTPDEQPFPDSAARGSGFAGKFHETGSYIRIPHDDLFNRFGRCDDWTISFWYERGSQALTDGSISKVSILSKGGIVQEEFTDELTTWQKRPVKSVRVHEHSHHGIQKASRSKKDGGSQLKTRKPSIELIKKTTKRVLKRDKNIPMPDIDQTFNNFRTPFVIGAVNQDNTTTYHFQSSDGTNALHISASMNTTEPGGTNNSMNAWQHVTVRNLNQTASFFINGFATGSSGSLPQEPNANASDLMFGRYHTYNVGFVTSTVDRKGLIVDKGFYQVEGDMNVDGRLVLNPGANLSVRGALTVTANGSIITRPGSELNVYGAFNNGGTLSQEVGSTVEVYGDWVNDNFGLAEFRMYDYGLAEESITSLSDRDYLTGSLYQTNVVGNAFYRNAQLVITSPMPLYSSGSGAWFNNWHLRYRGTHKIYENNVLVRVPKDLCNVSMNPSATYQIPTVGDACQTNQRNTLPGEFRKHMFVSGTAFPYITTIGLYDDDCRLLAVGKMAQPITKRDDVDMNFIVRWDY